MRRNITLLLMVSAVLFAAATPPSMSLQDVADYLGLTTRTVRQMVSDGRLKAYRLGPRVIRFRRSEVDSALEPIDAA
jgi:excisionase family DNA binding protein